MRPGPLLVAAACLVFSSPTARAQESRFDLTTVALTGDPAPGVEPALFDEIGAYVDIFNPDPFTAVPALGASGALALLAEYGGDGRPSTRDGEGSGVWRRAGGSLEVVAREGDPAPGADGAPFVDLFTPADHVDGLAFPATVTAGGFDRMGLWSNRGGTLQLLMLADQALADLPGGATVFQFANVARGRSVLAEIRWCDETFLCDLRYEGLWRDAGAGLRAIVRRGDPAPGFGAAQVFDDSSNASANTGPVHRWNGSEAGRVIFNGYVVGPRIDSGNNEGLWMESASGLVLLAREGQKVPGLQGWRWGAASGFMGFGDDIAMRAHILTDNGLALWGASINNRKFNRVNGVWTNRTGSVVQLVQTVRRDAFVGGQPPQSLATPAPGFPPGHRFRQVFAGRMNVHGDIYLDADVASEADPANPNPPAAIFRIRRGSSQIELVARRDGPVPGIPGTTFAAMTIGRLFDTGHFLWAGRLQGAGVHAGNDQAAFLTGPDGTTRALFRTGDLVDVSGEGSDRRVLAAFGADNGPRSGGPVVRLAFEMLFTDGASTAMLGELVP